MATYRGNMDDSLIMKSELELKYLWVKFSKTKFDSKTKKLQVDYNTQAYRVSEWDDMRRQCARHNLDFQQATGWDSYEVLHDPSLLKNEDDIKKLKIN